MPSIKLASSTWNAVTAALAAGAGSRAPAAAAQLPLDVLSRTPFLELKERQLQSADFWYRFALMKPLVDVRRGVPVHVLATNVLSSPEDSVSVRRLIQRLKPSVVLLQHTPEVWNDAQKNDKARQRIKNFIKELIPCAKAARSPFPSCRRAEFPGRFTVEEAQIACVKEEEERLLRFYDELTKVDTSSTLLHPDFVRSCQLHGNIPKWECFVAFLEAIEHGIDLKAIDMPLECSKKQVERVEDVWAEVLARPPEEKLMPIVCGLAKAADLEIGDLLQMAPVFGEPSVLYSFLSATGIARLFPPQKVKKQLCIDSPQLYGTVDLRGLRAINEFLSNAETGHPPARAAAATAEEYLAYALWQEIEDRHGAGAPTQRSSTARNNVYERLYPIKTTLSDRVSKALLPPKTRRGEIWRAFGEMGGVIENAEFVVPSVPHHFEGRFVPPAPQATLSSRRVLFIVEREHLPGIIRYWKRLNAAVPMEERFDSRYLPRTPLASDEAGGVPKAGALVE